MTDMINVCWFMLNQLSELVLPITGLYIVLDFLGSILFGRS